MQRFTRCIIVEIERRTSYRDRLTRLANCTESLHYMVDGIKPSYSDRLTYKIANCTESLHYMFVE